MRRVDKVTRDNVLRGDVEGSFRQPDIKQMLMPEALPELSSMRGGSSMKTVNICLDSFNKVESSNISRGEFKFNFNIQMSSSDQAIGVLDAINNVRSISLQQFAMPIIPDVPYNGIDISEDASYVDISDTSGTILFVKNNTTSVIMTPTGTLEPLNVYNDAVSDPPVGQYPITSLIAGGTSAASPWLTNPYTQTPFGNSITILLREMQAQSYIGSNNTRFHFDFFLTPYDILGNNPNMLQAVPRNFGKSDTFTFTDVIQSVHGLTIQFMNPDIPISFDQDVLTCQILIDSTVHTSGPPACAGNYIAFKCQNHNLRAGDRIYIDNLTIIPALKRQQIMPPPPVITYPPPFGELQTILTSSNGFTVNGYPLNSGTGTYGSVPESSPGTPLDPDYFYLDPAVSVYGLMGLTTSNGMTLQSILASQRPQVKVAKRRLRLDLTFYCEQKRPIGI